MIELRKINDNNKIIDEIFNKIDPIDKKFDRDLIYKFLEMGEFTILFDGFDEISFDLQEKITIEMREFIRKTNNNKFIITSRPNQALYSFVDFQEFKIRPLKKEESFEIIKKLDDLSNTDNGTKLINEIEAKHQKQIEEFLHNPLLVSLLYKSYSYNREVPTKKFLFYQEMYESFYKNHDISKEGFIRPKRSNLDMHDFEIILKYIGYETAKKGKISYLKDELMDYIKKAKESNKTLNFKEQDFYDDFIDAVPLFMKDGYQIKWVHKSIQDYFAAKFIVNHSQRDEILSIIFDKNRIGYLNILELVYEIDQKLFRAQITKKILEKFIEYGESQFKDDNTLDYEQKKYRLALTFNTDYYLYITNKGNNIEILKELAKQIQETYGKRCTKANAIGHKKERVFLWLFLYNHENKMLEISLLKMLYQKKEPFFGNFTFQDSIQNQLDCIFKEAKVEHFYKIDDKTEMFYNNPENFSYLNYKMSKFLEKHFLDIDKCKLELDSIKKEIEEDKSEEILSDI